MAESEGLLNSERGKLSRREFFLNAGLVLGGLMSLGSVGYFGARYLLAGLRPVRYERILASRLEDIPETGAMDVTVVGRPLILRRRGDQVRAFSSVCTHLGCLVKWEEDENRFYCPCHIGIFDPDGQTVSGPITEPLIEFDVNVEGDNVYIRLPEMDQVGV